MHRVLVVARGLFRCGARASNCGVQAPEHTGSVAGDRRALERAGLVCAGLVALRLVGS